MSLTWFWICLKLKAWNPKNQQSLFIVWHSRHQPTGIAVIGCMLKVWLSSSLIHGYGLSSRPHLSENGSSIEGQRRNLCVVRSRANHLKSPLLASHPVCGCWHVLSLTSQADSIITSAALLSTIPTSWSDRFSAGCRRTSFPEPPYTSIRRGSENEEQLSFASSRMDPHLRAFESKR